MVSSEDPTRPWAHPERGAYSVTEWGSNPDETDNDDCWTGSDFATLSEARAEMTRLLAGSAERGTAYVMLDGPDVHEVAPVPAYHTPAARARREREERAERDAWRREMAYEAGMLHGCDGYNEVMGW